MDKKSRQEICDVLNSFKVIESDPEYILVPNKYSNLTRLLSVGIPTERIEAAVSDDGETIDILALAFMNDEPYADTVENSKFIVWGPVENDAELLRRVREGGGTANDAYRLLTELDSAKDQKKTTVGAVIHALVMSAHVNAVEHGWWEPDEESGAPRTFGECIALVHSELSEALEFYREGRQPNQLFYTGKFIGSTVDSDEKTDTFQKPDGIPAELADVVIRIFDIAGRWNIDLGRAIIEKMEYNKSRPYRHGGKAL